MRGGIEVSDRKDAVENHSHSHSHRVIVFAQRKL
jgi:hypothetical protein